MMRRHTVIHAPAILALVLAAVSSAVAQEGPPATPVRVEAARMRQLNEQREVTGELRAISRANIATQEEGVIRELLVEEGDAVKAGDVLARLDARRLEFELARAQAQITVARAVIKAREAQVALRQSDLDALRELETRRASNPKELADAQSELLVAQADLESAQRDLDVLRASADLLGVRLEDMTLRAPFDGAVVSVTSEVGEWLGMGEPLLELVSVGAYEAWLSVPQRFAPAFASNDASVAVQVDATGFRADGLKPTVIPRVDPQARAFQVYAILEDGRGALKPGMSLTGWVPSGRKGEFLVVSRDGLMRNDIGLYVYVARETAPENYAAFPAQLDVLFYTKEGVAVRPGSVAPGDLVIVEGNERLYPSAAVAISERRAPPGRAGASQPGAADSQTASSDDQGAD